MSVVSRNPSRMFSNMTAAPHIFQDIWHIPGHQAYSRKSVILQEICHLSENLAYSRKSSIYLPVNMPSSRKSGIFQDIKHIPGNQIYSRKLGIFQEIRERGHELSSNVFWVPRTKWTICHNLDIYASVFRVFCNIKNMKIQVLLLFRINGLVCLLFYLIWECKFYFP